MNLYKIMFDHYSQKDSERGIITYLVAESDESVYEWLKSEPRIGENGTRIFTSYKYSEKDGETFAIYDDAYDVIGAETFKDRMIRLHGDMFDEDADLSDLYYGKTLYGWKMVKEDAKPDVLQTIKDYGVAIVKAN